jgi:hypothetical protein
MKKITARLGVVLSLFGMNASHAGQQEWPPLPNKRFVSGRAATVQDVDKGDAIFVAKVGDEVIGKPILVTIPQFAYWTNEDGKRLPVVVIQAEEANGKRLFGFRDVLGKDHVGTAAELTLLGTTPPN